MPEHARSLSGDICHVRTFCEERSAHRAANRDARDRRAHGCCAKNVPHGDAGCGFVGGWPNGIASDGQRESRSVDRSGHWRCGRRHARKHASCLLAHAVVVRARRIAKSQRDRIRESHALHRGRRIEQRRGSCASQGPGKRAETVALTTRGSPSSRDERTRRIGDLPQATVIFPPDLRRHVDAMRWRLHGIDISGTSSIGRFKSADSGRHRRHVVCCGVFGQSSSSCAGVDGRKRRVPSTFRR